MEFLNTIVWFLVALIILVTVHEFGHFYAARLCGVKVLRFSVGFGTPLLKWTDKQGTEFALAGIPLGGYVKMLDEREGEVPDNEVHLAFTRKSVWQRMFIAAAGPGVNFLLAALLFWIIMVQGTVDRIPIVGEVQPGSIAAEARLEEGQEIVAIDGKATPTQRDVVMRLMDRLGETGEIHFSVRYPNSKSPELLYESDATLQKWMQGTEEPNPLQGIGLGFQSPPVEMGEILEGGPAAMAGFKTGDRVLYADDTAIETWGQWVEYIQARPNQNIDVFIEREGREQSIVVTPRSVTDETSGKIVGKIEAGGQFPEAYVRRYEYSIFEAGVEGVNETKDAAVFILISIKKLIFGEISTKNLSGPITIAKVAGSTANDGWMYFVQFLAWLSVSLGVLNLLPIPVLDGGHILYCLVEALKGSPVSERVQVIGYQVGLFMVVGIMVLALYNDLLRL
jgi:regulator of sigma E protease